MTDRISNTAPIFYTAAHQHEWHDAGFITQQFLWSLSLLDTLEREAD